MVRWWGIGAVAGLLLVAGCGDSASETASKSAVPNDLDQQPVTEATMYARAQAAEQQGKPREAITLYRDILDTYPESPQNYKAEFLIGFIYSEKLSEQDSARAIFTRILETYPDCEFADDAQAMLRFLDGELPEFEDTPAS